VIKKLFLPEKEGVQNEQDRMSLALEEERLEEQNRWLGLRRVLLEVKYEEETAEFLRQMLEKR